MIMLLLCLYIAIISSVVEALQFPVEYHYDYAGQITTGIPELRSQVAAAGLKANLTIQFRSKIYAIAKLSDVRVGLFNGDVGCEMREPVPFEYYPIPEPTKTQLELPFAFIPNDKESHIMTVPEGEIEYITNIRKSIISTLIIEPLLRNHRKGMAILPKGLDINSAGSFEVEEDSISGTCINEYSMTKLHQVKGEELLKRHGVVLPSIDDIQRHSTRSLRSSIPQILEDLWLVTKSVNFDRCRDRVILQKSTIGATGKEGTSQNKYLQGHSLRGQYLLRGSPGSLRLECALVEEALIINPFGIQLEKMMTSGNQSLTLRNVTEIKKPIVLPKKIHYIYTWKSEMTSPFVKPPKSSTVWINYYGKAGKRFSSILPLLPQHFMTGIQRTNITEETFMLAVDGLLDDAVLHLLEVPSVSLYSDTPWSESASVASSSIYAASQALKGIGRDGMEKLWRKIYEGNDKKSHIKQMLLADACIASGDAVAISHIMQNLLKKPHSDISRIREMTLMLALGHNLASPPITELLLKYLKNVTSQNNPILTSIAVINLATGARRMCIPDISNISSPQKLYGTSVCQETRIIRDIIAFSKSQISETKLAWQKCFYVVSVARLGSREGVLLLKQAALGQLGQDILLRSIAIRVSTAHVLPQISKLEVFNLLNTIAMDEGENLVLRQDAFLSLLSWNPSTSWWDSVARLTWYDRSHQFAAFVSFTLRTFASTTNPAYREQSKKASMSLPLMKPYTLNFHYSFHQLMAQLLPEAKMSASLDVILMTDFENEIFPREIFFLLKSDLGGMEMDFFEFDAAFQGVKHVFHHLTNGYKASHKRVPSNVNPEMAEQLVDEMTRIFGLEEKAGGEAQLVYTFFKNMMVFLPLNSDVLAQLFGPGGVWLIHRLTHNYPLNLNKFFLPVMNEFYLPTSVGLPLIHTEAISVLTAGEGHIDLESKGQNETVDDILKSKNLGVNFEVNFRLNTKTLSKTTVLVPWASKSIATAVDHVKTINFPVEGLLQLNRTTKLETKAWQNKWIYNESFCLMYGHTIPYTLVEEMVPTRNLLNSTDVRPIGVEESRRPVVQWETSTGWDFTGYEGVLRWESDNDFSLTEETWIDILRHPTQFVQFFILPSVRKWKLSLTLDYKASETTSVETSLSLIARSSHVYDAMNTSETIANDLNTFVRQEKTSLSLNNTDTERLHQLGTHNGEMVSVSVRGILKFISAPGSRIYDVSVRWKGHKPHVSIYQKGNLNVFSFFEGIPNYFDRGYRTCSALVFEMPNLQDTTTFRARLERTQIKPRFALELQAGNICNENTFFRLFGDLDISEERRQRLVTELDSSCNTAKYEPLIDLRTVPTYDRVKCTADTPPGIPNFARRLGFNLDRLMLGLSFPKSQSFFLGVNNPAHQISFEGKRPLNSNEWTFWNYKPYENSRFKDIHIPLLFTRILPYQGLGQHNTPKWLYSNAHCSVSGGEIKTFDDMRLSNIDLNSCWTLISGSIQNGEEWMLLARKSPFWGKLEVKFASVPFNFVATFSSLNMEVNGKAMTHSSLVYKNREGQVVLQVFRRARSIKINLSQSVKIEVDGSIRIWPSPRVAGTLLGVCGSFDGRKEDDIIGSNGCSYAQNNKLLIATWTSFQNCNRTDSMKKWQEVLKFEARCHLPHNENISFN